MSTSRGGNGRRVRRLKPAGHSATIEALIQPAIVVASTLMSAIAAYVLAYDEISKLLANQGSWQDAFVVALCVGMGFLIDMAIIVSATRYKMHAVRADPREKHWLRLAKWVLIIGLCSETMTLFYFFVHLDPAAYPSGLVWLAGIVHAFLVSARAFLPPVVVAYFAAGVLPISFDRADRNREIKTRTSTNVMALIDQLSVVHDTDDTAEKLRALGGQLVLDTYATYDETGRTTEDEQLRRDGKLLAHMARMHGLDWSRLGVDVAPELVTPASAASGAASSAASSRTAELPAPTMPAMPAKPLSRHDQRRMDLEASQYTDLKEYPADDYPADDYNAWDDDGRPAWRHVTAPRQQPAMNTRMGNRASSASAARMAPQGAALAIDLDPFAPSALELALELPVSKYEQDDDSDQRRAVFRVLDQALARGENLNRRQVAERAGVNENTVRTARTSWDERRAKRSRKRVAPSTVEMPAITADMLQAAAPVGE